MAHDHGDHKGHHDDGDHGHHHEGHGHGHGHENDQGLAAMVRYLRFAPRMWRSEVNDAVVDIVDPRKGETVVDIGAGMGPAVVRAAAKGALVVAVEPTPFMRRIVSTRRLLSRNRKSITVSDGGAESLPLGDREADAVWAVNTMHHWINPAEGVSEIARVLRPGGRAVLVDEDFADPAHPESQRWQDDHGDDHHHGFSMVDATEFGTLMSGAGLTNVVAEQRQVAGRPVIAVLAEAPF